jgi:hypothetical protein
MAQKATQFQDRLYFQWAQQAQMPPQGTLAVVCRRAQLFFEVVAWKAAHCCSTFAPPHFGHLILFFSCSAMLMTTENFLLQAWQRYS